MNLNLLLKAFKAFVCAKELGSIVRSFFGVIKRFFVICCNWFGIAGDWSICSLFLLHCFHSDFVPIGLFMFFLRVSNRD